MNAETAKSSTVALPLTELPESVAVIVSGVPVGEPAAGKRDAVGKGVRAVVAGDEGVTAGQSRAGAAAAEADGAEVARDRVAVLILGRDGDAEGDCLPSRRQGPRRPIGAGLAGLTETVALLEVPEPVSVAVMVWLPAVFSVTLKVMTPLLPPVNV